MIRFSQLSILLSALLLTAAAPALAGDLDITLETYRVIATAAGGERLEQTDAAQPGATLEYRATYENRGSETLRGIRGVLPIPVGTSYVADTAQPAAAEASLDGEHYAPIPLRRQLPETGRWEAVPLSEYRFVRFQVGDLEAQTRATVAARVTIPLRTAAAVD